MVNDWVDTTLGDISTEVSYGYTESANTEKVGPRFLRITDIQNGVVDWNTVPYCPIDDSKLKRYLLEKGDIVVARTGNSTGENYIFTGEENTVYASYLIKFKIDQSIANPFYVWYSMRSPNWWAFINSSKTGSAQAGANAKVLGSYPLNLPSLDTQKAIAHILGSLDDKIELNRQMNETLEAMAQALFKSWFVDFDPVIDNALAAGDTIPDEWLERAEQRQAMQHSDSDNQAIRALFPDAFEFTEEMGWIPKGWNVRRILDLSEKLTKGTTPSKADLSKAEDEASIPFLKVMNIDNNGFIKTEKLEDIPKSIHEGSLKRSIVKEGDVLFSIAGTIGRTSIIPKKLDNSNVNQAIAFIRLKDSKKSNFLLQLLKSEEVQNIVHSKIVQAVQANFSLTELGSLILAEPSNNVFDSWFEKTESIFMKISDLQDNTSALAKLRDTLLPKLLSGELSIPDAAAMVEDA
jgi:type I restriction enzyme S subunit